MILLIIFLCVIWGFNWVVMKTALVFFPPVLFSAYRFLCGSLVLLAICWYKRIPWPEKQQWKWYGVCGLFQITYSYVINQQALLYAEAGISSLLCFTMPFWLALMAHFLLPGERLTAQKMIGLFIGICGLILVMGINPFQMEWNRTELMAELLVLSTAVAWAATNIIIKKNLNDDDKIRLTTWQLVIGTIGLFAYSVLFERGQEAVWNATAVLCLLFAGVVASALAYVLWFYILANTEAGKASVSLLLVPVVGVVSGWLFLGESPAGWTLFGIILVLTGIGIVNLPKKTAMGLFDKQRERAQFEREPGQGG